MAGLGIPQTPEPHAFQTTGSSELIMVADTQPLGTSCKSQAFGEASALSWVLPQVEGVGQCLPAPQAAPGPRSATVHLSAAGSAWELTKLTGERGTDQLFLSDSPASRKFLGFLLGWWLLWNEITHKADL